MRFKPGDKKPPGSGRTKGTPNKKTNAFKQLLDDMGFNPLTRIYEKLDTLDAKDQVDVCLKLLEFIYPKRKPIEDSSGEGELAGRIQLTDEQYADLRTSMIAERRGA